LVIKVPSCIDFPNGYGIAVHEIWRGQVLYQVWPPGVASQFWPIDRCYRMPVADFAEAVARERGTYAPATMSI
jgi:hypothetical protein